MVKIRINESQYNMLLLSEENNNAFDRKKVNGDNMKAIWAEIDRKQKELHNNLFGELSDKLYDITIEKAKAMGDKYLRVPNTICTAGNDKLPENVLIINMSSSLMCPSFYLGLCTIKNGACYAQRDENRLTNTVTPNRWQTDLMHTQMLQQYKSGNKNAFRIYFGLIEKYIQLANAYSENLYKKELARINRQYLKLYKREMTENEKNVLKIQYMKHKISDVRLNETGDFQCQLAVDLWTKFAMKIKKKYNINTHAYTARNLDFSNASKHMAINPSHKGINVGSYNTRMFKAVDNSKFNSLEWCELNGNQPILKVDDKGVYYYKCPCDNNNTKCDECGVCFAKNETGKPYTIFVKYHGITAANGLKSLFKKDEVSNVIERLYANGWITDDEYENYNSEANQSHLDRLSSKIDIMRANSKEKSKK